MRTLGNIHTSKRLFPRASRVFTSALVCMVSCTFPLSAQQPHAKAVSHIVTGMPYYGQIYTEDCEIAALQMALAHEGISVSQLKLLSAANVSTAAPVVGATGDIRYWGDPNTSFVGHPNADSIGKGYSAASGYGTYAPNIARVAKRFGATVLWSGQRLTQKQLKDFIDNNHPVIAWVGDRAGRMRFASLATWTAWDGSTVEYPDPKSGVYEHCVVVAGWSDEGVYVEDPLVGAQSGSNVNPAVGPGWVSWQTFLDGFRTFHNMAVVLK